jgi:hypothetical protein
MNSSKNRKLANILHVVGLAWLILVSLLIIVSIIGIFISEPNLFLGWKRVTEVFSPFNITNFIVTVIIVSPAIIAFKLEEYFNNK